MYQYEENVPASVYVDRSKCKMLWVLDYVNRQTFYHIAGIYYQLSKHKAGYIYNQVKRQVVCSEGIDEWMQLSINEFQERLLVAGKRMMLESVKKHEMKRRKRQYRK
jgi:hypothetical protein